MRGRAAQMSNRHAHPSVPLFPFLIGDVDDPTMKQLLLLFPTALALAACGSSGPTRDTSQRLCHIAGAVA
jgi:hypothetical protein